MAATGPPEGAGHGIPHDGAGQVRPPTTGLLDDLGVAAVVLEEDGRIALWSPQAEKLLGYTAAEALGHYANHLIVDDGDAPDAVALFERMMNETGAWAGIFPVRHKDGRIRRVELRGTRLCDAEGRAYALGLAAEETAVREMETGLALSVRLVAQSPIGLAVFDTDLRFVSVNPALERINGVPEAAHLGRTSAEALPELDNDTVTSAMREVLSTGRPLVDQHVLGRTAADPGADHAWSVSFYRLEGPGGRVLGLAASVVDITERYRSASEAATVRSRLALIADASERIGTTLDLERTAHELADLCVPALADVAAVDVLDSVLNGARGDRAAGSGQREPAAFRALAVAAARTALAVRAADQPGEVANYDPDRLITRCVTTARAVMVPHVTPRDLNRIARDEEAAGLLAEAGVHSYLAVPLIARGEVLGALDLKRARNPLPFTQDDETLATELAARAAVCIDNARWYQKQRHAALALQRHLLPHQPPERPGLEIAYRYAPAEGPTQVGGDWFDVISLTGDRTALVVGDVMGSGINAAATMGQVRTATRTLAELDLEPDALLRQLDKITSGLEAGIATCVYAVHDPRTRICRVAVAGHLPPALSRPGEPPRLLDLPTGVPLGVGGVPFEITAIQLRPGDQLVLYTDGLVETRNQSLDAGLDDLLALLGEPERPLQQTCDLLLDTLRQGNEPDDVALLVSRIGPPPAA
ncbi:SpoIIE family protein phosphatase [Streptantibioticus silvisoli]|uniref:SpoIIE family protein phosphatase n=1 Tax=Streptantibioticus silvisoli TaxID=2705255 RepID=A0ABT6VVW9_9ACTN|nr:SpoIIE family protein phosphatase [Streptantibioticus silvisoli]MDI5962617.1 SpoIIE family protein phosphatase [Streptantibioticus silvisoli]